MKRSVSEVLSELRALIASDETIHDGDMVDATAVHTAIQKFALKLEEAWKNEKAEWGSAACACVSDAVMSGRIAVVHPPVGNAAALREALQALKERFRDIDLAHDSLEKEIYELSAAALSAPARNCDIYSNAKEALKAHEEAFDESNFQHGECRLGCQGCDDGLIDCKILWLFAPAAERKGEGDGR
jgi:hypothetical protein